MNILFVRIQFVKTQCLNVAKNMVVRAAIFCLETRVSDVTIKQGGTCGTSIYNFVTQPFLIAIGKEPTSMLNALDPRSPDWK